MCYWSFYKTLVRENYVTKQSMNFHSQIPIPVLACYSLAGAHHVCVESCRMSRFLVFQTFALNFLRYSDSLALNHKNYTHVKINSPSKLPCICLWNKRRIWPYIKSHLGPLIPQTPLITVVLLKMLSVDSPKKFEEEIVKLTDELAV